jgi:epoxyqueuosine reductase QueG
MEETFPGKHFAAEELTVISWVLPQTDATRNEHRMEKLHPSKRWSATRIFGEEFNNSLRRYVLSLLLKKGCAAVAPVLSSLWSLQMSEKYGYASNWSERHAAFAGGLGTFGLSDGLITARGKSVRCGSVVAAIAIPPTPRPYVGHQEYCLHQAAGKCGRCAARCPAGAISTSGHDKEKCRTYIRQVSKPYIEKHFGLSTNACGLCQVGVPCESGIPVRT